MFNAHSPTTPSPFSSHNIASLAYASSKMCPFVAGHKSTFQNSASGEKQFLHLFNTYSRFCPVMNMASNFMSSDITGVTATKTCRKPEAQSCPYNKLQKSVLHLKTDPAEKKFDYDGEFQKRIQSKKDDHSYRVFKTIARDACKLPHAKMFDSNGNTKDVIVWCSNDYLGMSAHPEVKEAVKMGLASSNSEHSDLKELERRLASFHKKEDAIVFPSCYIANDIALSALGSTLPNCTIFSDSENHASMIHGIKNSKAKKVIYSHNDVKHLEKCLSQADNVGNHKIVAFETVHSMTGAICDLRRLCDTAHRFGAITFVDEVHAVGLYGQTGAGVGEREQIEDKIDIISGTLGKAFGNNGGYIASSSDIIQTIRNSGLLQNSMPKCVIEGCLASLNLLSSSQVGQKLRETHENRVLYMRNALKRVGIHSLTVENNSHVIPIVMGDPKLTTSICDTLLSKFGHYVQPINYPTVAKGDERLRIAPTPFHTIKMIDQFVSDLRTCWISHGLEVNPTQDLDDQRFKPHLMPFYRQNGEEITTSNKESNNCIDAESDVISVSYNKYLKGKNSLEAILGNSQGNGERSGEMRESHFEQIRYSDIDEVQKHVFSIVDKHGVGSGGTRNISGNSIWHQKLEQKLASFHNKSSGLIFTNGFAANETAVMTLAKILPGLCILRDSACHPSIERGISNVQNVYEETFQFNDAEDLYRKISKIGKSVPKLVILSSTSNATNSTSMFCSNLESLCDVTHEFGGLTYVDESACVGKMGADLRKPSGLASFLGVENKIDVLCGDLHSVCGSYTSGGYLCGNDSNLVDTIRSYGCGFIFTTSLSPVLLNSSIITLDLCQSRSYGVEFRKTLTRKVNLLKHLLIEQISSPSMISIKSVGTSSFIDHQNQSFPQNFQHQDFGILVEYIGNSKRNISIKEVIENMTSDRFERINLSNASHGVLIRPTVDLCFDEMNDFVGDFVSALSDISVDQKRSEQSLFDSTSAIFNGRNFTGEEKQMSSTSAIILKHIFPSIIRSSSESTAKNAKCCKMCNFFNTNNNDGIEGGGKEPSCCFWSECPLAYDVVQQC